MKVKKYEFLGTVYIDEDELKEIAEDFLKREGKDGGWKCLNDYIWDFYGDCDNWEQVMDEITDDVFEIYEELAGRGNEEE